jgi:hypothetical protein
VALGGEARALFAEEAFQFGVAVVERVDDVRGRAAGLAARDGAVVQYDDAPALAREQVGGGQAGDPGPDDDHVRFQILFESAVRARRVRRRHPDRDALAVVSLQLLIPPDLFVKNLSRPSPVRALFPPGEARADPPVRRGRRNDPPVSFCRWAIA